MLIREYEALRDAAALRACFVELQDFERSLERDAPPGDAIADDYLGLMLARCTRWDGRVFVAESDGAMVGFVCLWSKVPPDEPDESPEPYGLHGATRRAREAPLRRTGCDASNPLGVPASRQPRS